MNILNLPAWSVLDTREADHDYHITVQLSYPPSHCPHCGYVRIIVYAAAGKVHQLSTARLYVAMGRLRSGI